MADDARRATRTAPQEALDDLLPVGCACEPRRHPAKWHLGGRCAGDFLSCPCTARVEPVSEGREP